MQNLTTTAFAACINVLTLIRSAIYLRSIATSVLRLMTWMVAASINQSNALGLKLLLWGALVEIS
ncbi:hypothetical protein BJP36_24255 [Moorena producens JHB]|uniref:Uncharacterized protein n=1 Tax=Moorena producens (strain JHB) TaxID=1454205 RepID=A0A1D9G4V7_MOOP1|nr:hypothetical protein [Moorena producens]AOY82564.1 hypothetical protein BJP36_24255 [Moorena producens JHB]